MANPHITFSMLIRTTMDLIVVSLRQNNQSIGSDMKIFLLRSNLVLYKSLFGCLDTFDS